MSLKIELKPRERVLIGESLITNGDQRTHMLIDGRSPVLREKDIMTREQANTPSKRIYLAVQLMYLTRDPREHHEIYFALVRDITAAAPSTWPYIESVNNQILTGHLYKALKEVRKLIVYEEKLLNMPSVTKAYETVALQIASPRELEASLLRQAASRLQAAHDNAGGSSPQLDEALQFNRKLWTLLLTSVTSPDNPLPVAIRQNVANIGIFVINHTMAILGNPRAEQLGSLIHINREIAAGLTERA